MNNILMGIGTFNQLNLHAKNDKSLNRPPLAPPLRHVVHYLYNASHYNCVREHVE